MPNQEITVGLRFTADTQQAKTQLNSLKTDLMNLSNLTTTNAIGEKMAQGLNEAHMAAAKLKTQLDAATNVKTGNLDLTKFNKQLQMSGTSLGEYRNKLASLGPSGQQAFLQLATSIQTAEIPLIRINNLFGSLWESLKRTVGWQISSTAIHAFMGAIQGAYRYAQDLNESLNDIRIVTGKSIDDMSKFAAEANRAAKALSSTTNEYAKASLIFYQQGLDGSDVTERANIVVKMSNVTGEAASSVSDYMTAVWNNFADGTQTLESFADKMTALGAATASSTDEIATGLEKFAAVGQTVGLSFDYAAAALATITATTRQSADTVGTALKTLFSRLQGLKLGETLEDGTDLNKYSAGLASVGINIKNANGELKDMDTILDETMAKWKTLTRDQQMALAQTVAGVRQYNQFMTLMNNADFFKQNLQTEATSSGTLQKQADIYAESWEAAQKRVKTSAEAIYSDLIDDKFFIELTNNLANILNFIERLIKSMGGLPGLLSTISTLVFTIAGDKIANSIRNISFDIQNLLTKGAAAKDLKLEAVNQTKRMLLESSSNGKEISPTVQAQADSFERISKLQIELSNNAKELSQEQLNYYKTLIQTQQAREQENIQIANSVTNAKEKVKTAKEELAVVSAKVMTESGQQRTKVGGKAALSKSINVLEQKITNTQERKNQLEGKTDKTKEEIEELAELTDQLTKYNDELVRKKQLTDNQMPADEEGLTENQSKRLANLNTEITLSTEMEERLNQLGTAYLAQAQNINQATEGTAEYDQYQKQLIQSEEALKQALIDSNQVSQEEIDKAFSVTDAKERQEAITKLLKDAESGQKEATDELANSQEKFLEKTALTEKRQKEITSATKNQIQASRDLQEKEKLHIKTTNELNISYQKFKTEIGQVATKITGYAASVTQAARTLSGLAMSFNAFKGMIDTLNNQDLSFGEKLTGVLMSLPMVLGGVTSAISGGIKAFQNFGGAIRATIGLQEGLQGTLTFLNNMGEVVTKTGAEALSSAAKTKIASELKKGAYDEETKANIKKIIAEELGIDIGKKSAEADAVDAMATNMVTAAKKVQTKTIWEKIGAQIVEHWYILLIIAAIAALVAIIYVLVRAYNREAEAAKQANENLEQAKKDAEEAAAAYKDLNDRIEKLEKAKDVFKDLKEGTQEWKEAVVDVNQQMLDLISLYPELAEFVRLNSEGIYEFTDGGKALNDLKERKLDQMQTAQNNQLAAQIGVQQTGASMTASNAARNITGNNIMGPMGIAGAGLGGALGIYGIAAATIASVQAIPVVGQVIGAIGALGLGITGIVGAIKESNLEDAFQHAADKIVEGGEIGEQELQGLFKGATLENGMDLNSFVRSLDLATSEEEALINALNSSNETIKKSAQDTILALVQNGTETKAMTEMLATQIATQKTTAAYGDDIKAALEGKGLNADELGGKIANVVGAWNKDAIADSIDGAMKEFRDKNDHGMNLTNQELKRFIGDNLWNGSNDDEALARRFAFAKGYTKEQIDAATYKSGSNQGTLNINGEELAVNDDYARYFIWYTEAQKKAGEEFDANSEKVKDQIEEITKIAANADALGQQYGADFTSAILQSLATGKQEILDMSEINKELDFDELQSLLVQGNNELAQSFGITDEVAKEAGWDNANQYIQALREGLEQWSFDEYFQHQLDKIGEMATEAGLNAKEVQDYAQYLTEAGGTLDGFNDSMYGDIELAGKAAIAIAKMDKGIQGLSDNLKDAKKGLTENARGTLAYSKALNTIMEDVANITNVDKKYLSESFILEHMKDIELAAKADEDAIERLQMAAAREMSVKIAATLTDDNGDPINESMRKQLTSAVEDLTNLIPDIEIGANLNTEQYEEAIQRILTTTGMTADKAREIFSAMNLDVDFEVERKKISKTVTEDVTEHWIDEIDDPVTLNGQQVYKHWVERTATTPGASKNIDTYIDVPKISTGDHKATITSATKVLDGGTVSKPTVKGGSGSSGSKSSQKPKKKSDETDRYHLINKELERLGKEYDRIDKIKDRAFGAKHIAAIDAEIAKLDEQSAALEKKIEENKKYLAEDAGYALGVGAQLDEHGHIANYNELIEQWVDAYNAGSIDDDEYSRRKSILDKYEETLGMAEDLYDEHIDKIREKLDKEFEKIQYTVEFLVEVNDASLEQLKWQLSHLDDSSFASAQRLALMSAQTPYLQANANVYQNNITDELIKAGASDDTIQQFFATGNIVLLQDLNLTDEIAHKLIDWRDNLKDIYDTLVELRDSALEEIVKTQEEYNKKIEEGFSELEHYANEYEHIKNIIDIVGKEQLGITSDIYKNLRLSSIANIEAQKNAEEARYNMLVSQQDSLKGMLKDYYDEQGNLRTDLNKEEQDTFDKVSEQIADMDGQIRESQEQIWAKDEELLQAWVDHRKEVQKELVEAWEETVAGPYKSITKMSEEFERRRKMSDLYLPGYKQTYELNKIARDINNQIDSSQNLRTQKRLNDFLRDEIKILQSKEKITEYDLQVAQKRYDLLKAQIALEEAQNAKNQVRLQRDSQGNYSYVYTADQNNIDKAMQDVENAMYALQDLNETRINDLQEQYMTILQEYTEWLKNTDDLSREEFERINQYYLDQLGAVSGFLDTALTNNKNLYEQDYLAYWKAVKEKELGNTELLDNFSNFTTSFDETFLGPMLGNYETFSEAFEDLVVNQIGSIDSETGLLYDLYSNQEEWREKTAEILELAGEDLSTYGDSLNGYLEDIKTKTDAAKQGIKGWADQSVIEIGKIANAVETITQKINTAIDRMAKLLGMEVTPKKTIINPKEHAEKMARVGLGPTFDEKGLFGEVSPNYTASQTANTGIPGDIPARSLKDIVKEEISQNWESNNLQHWHVKTTFWSDGSSTTSPTDQSNHDWSVNQYCCSICGKRRRKKQIQTGTQTQYQVKYYTGTKWVDDELYDDAVKASTRATILRTTHGASNVKVEPVSTVIMGDSNEWEYFKTGGYTGEFGNEGRLGILHEKELVLNQEDTQNLLSSVKLIRELSNVIDLQALTSQNALLQNPMLANNNLSSYWNNQKEQTIQQEITINADFPGVTVSKEIEDAFDNLALTASQYAYRNSD